MILENLVAHLGFEVDKKPLDQVQDKLEHIGSRLEFLAASEIVRGIYELAERFSGLGEQIETAAISAGITTEEFQKLAFAASQNAVSQDELSGALARLNRGLYQAKEGSKTAVDAFAAVGISPQQIAGFKTSKEALHAVSDAFTRIDDPIKKQALAMELFGRSSANMVKLLSVGGQGIDDFGDQAEKMGAVLSGEAIESLAKFEDTVSSLGQVVKVFLASVAANFAPILTEVIKEIEKLWGANQAIIAQDIEDWAVKAAYAFGAVFEIVRIVVGIFITFAQAHPLLVKRSGELWLALIAVSLAISGIVSAIGFVVAPFVKLAGLMSTVGSVGATSFGLVTRVVLAFKGALGALLLRLAVLAETAFPALSEAAFALGAALQGMTTGGFLLWAGGVALAIGAVVLVVQEIWALLHGKSFWDTWIGEGITAILKYGGKAMGFVKSIFGGQTTGTASTPEMDAEPSDFVASPPQQASKPAWRMDLSSLAQGGQTAMANLQGMGAAPVAAPWTFGADQTPVTYNMAQTNNITVPPGMDPKEAGGFIQRGVQEATERQLREAHRGLQTAAVH